MSFSTTDIKKNIEVFRRKFSGKVTTVIEYDSEYRYA